MSDWINVETYKSLIAISVEGFKSLILVNGGAIIAALTYLGQSKNDKLPVGEMTFPLGCFVVGIGFAVFALIFSYVTQFVLYNEVSLEKSGRRHMIFVWISSATVCLSLVAFAVGSFSSLSILEKFAGK